MEEVAFIAEEERASTGGIPSAQEASIGAVQVETQAKGLPTGLPTRTQPATVPGTHVAERRSLGG